MIMRVFIALLCCLMLSGCQHGVSLPAADNADTYTDGTYTASVLKNRHTKSSLTLTATVLRTLRHCRWRIRTMQS